MKLKSIALFSSLFLVLAFAACGDDDADKDSNIQPGNVTTNNANTSTGANTTTGANNTTTSANNTSTGNNNTSTSNNTSTGNNNTSGDRLEAHGCTIDNAMDMTGNATVNLSDIEAWAVPHNVCVIVDAGTEIVLDGNFSAHPLDGGVSPTEDTDNPIDVAGDGVTGGASVTFTLDTAGDYPYFCSIHTGSMTGVVYVN